MTLLLLLGGAEQPALVADPQDPIVLSVYLVSEDRTTRWPVYNWSSLTVDKGKHCTGTASISGYFELPWVLQMQDDASHPLDRYSLDVYYRDTTTPFFSGPLRSLTRSHDGTKAGARVEATFETFFQHFMRRRIAQRENMAEVKATTASTKADESAFYFMASAIADALGVTEFGSDVVHTDGTSNRTRAEWGPSWVVEMSAAPTFNAAIVDFEFASGSPILDVIIDTIERGACTVTITETSPANWELSVDDHYQLTDRTDDVVLSPMWGTTGALSWQWSTDAKSNAWTVMAGESGGTKLYSRLCDEADVDLRGTYEDFNSAGGGLDTNLSTVKERMVEVHTPEAESFEVELIERSGLSRLNADFYMRDLIRVYDDIFGEDREILVVGAKLSADETAAVSISLRLLAAPVSILQRLRAALPQPGGRNAGGLETPKFWK